MASKLKTFEGHIQFEAIGIRVRAKNLTEAKKKIKAKVSKLKPLNLLDKKNSGVDEV
jgi:hypothetical protein